MIKFKKMEHSAVTPERALDSAGIDLFAFEAVDVQPYSVAKIGTGIAFELPEGTVGFVKERSSKGSKGYAVRSGVIDQDYRGEIFVNIHNLTPDVYTVKMGEKIAQLVPLLLCVDPLERVDALSETTRGSNGFGSTGDN